MIGSPFPAWVKLAALGVALLGAGGVGAYIMHRFDEGTIADMKAAEAQASLAATVKSGQITDQFSAAVAKLDASFGGEFTNTIYLTQTLIREVPVHVTPEIDRRYPLPCGLLRMHDAAILGVDASGVAATGCPDDAAAAPVAASTLSANDQSNFGICHEDEVKVRYLQAYIATLTDIWNKARGGAK